MPMVNLMARQEGRHEEQAYGPFGFLNPTVRHTPLRFEIPDRASSSYDAKDEENAETPVKQPLGQETRAEDVERVWRSRDNRKGRHAILVTPETDQNARFLTPPSSSSAHQILHGIWRMLTWYPYWDVSYLVAVIFTFGSVVWCVNAFFVWLPLQDPSTAFNGEIADAGGISAFVGATIFEIGSVLLMLEAVNESRADCFGWAVEEVLEEKGMRRLKADGCVHHHHCNKHNLVGRGADSESSKDGASSKFAKAWTWWPSWHELTSHYFKEIGFLACLSQMIGATIFWISGFTALPPIYDRLTTTPAQNGAYWAPQVVGGTGFIISGVLFMLETQKKWYIPALKVLGWHIGAWNLIGGIGFTLCGALGFAASNSGAVYEGSLATFWGSWCFLIGSVIQWYESLDKHPVDVGKLAGREEGEKAAAAEAV